MVASLCRLKPHAPLALILLIYIVIATAHSLVAPFTLGNDEWAHFLYTRFIVEHDRLPQTLAERQNKKEVGTKSDDPPLYHLLVAAAASGVEPTRLLRPIDGDPRRQLADNVVASYAFLVHNGYELFPFQGEVLVWYIGRIASIIFGVMVILLTYVTGLALWSNRRQALAAAALLAFWPAFIFHSSVMSYDSLGAVLTALFLWLSINAINQPGSRLRWLLLGAVAGLATTTKYSSVLLPLEIVFVAWLAFKQAGGPLRRPEPAKAARRYFTAPLSRIALAGLALFLATGWWFGFVIWHFNTVESQGLLAGLLEPLIVRGGNDSTAISLTAFLFGGQAVSVDLPAPARPRNYPQLAWLMIESFGSAPVAEQFLLSPWLPLLFTAAGLISLAGLVRLWQKSNRQTRTWLLLLLFHSLLVTLLILIRLFLSFDPLEAVQGRHLLFPGASAIAILLVYGWQQWNPKLSQVIIVASLLWSVLGQLGWAALVYPPPIPLWTQTGPEPARAALTLMEAASPHQGSGASISPLWGVGGGAIRLTGAAWGETADRSALEIALWWQSEAIVTEDYLVELRLLDQADTVVSYALAHPVQGRYPTRAWEPGDLIKDVHWLPLVGRFDGSYQLQLRLLDRAAQPLAETKGIPLGQIALRIDNQPAAACATWFQGRPHQGGLLAQPYRLRATFSVIGPDQPLLKPWPGQANPAEQKPLISVDNFHLFIVEPDWAKTYQLFAGSQSCQTLSFQLPPRLFEPPQIPGPLLVNFNHEVRLLGYDLPTRRIRPGERLPLTLYWQALRYIGHDYQIFDNLLDHQQRRWGGYDRRAKDGYSTLLWAPGEIIVDRFGVPVDPAAPAGVYTIDVGLYHKTEAGALSLPLVIEDQASDRKSIRLGPIKVGGPPPAVTTAAPAPDVWLRQSFGGQITLLGYKLALSQTELKATLYWQAEAVPAADYTTFLHLRDSANQNAAQKDQPPANGQYPTSLWDTGEIIIDEINLPLAGLAPGQYSLVVGLYDFASGARLPLAGTAAATAGAPAGQINELQLESITIP